MEHSIVILLCVLTETFHPLGLVFPSSEKRRGWEGGGGGGEREREREREPNIHKTEQGEREREPNISKTEEGEGKERKRETYLCPLLPV